MTYKLTDRVADAIFEAVADFREMSLDPWSDSRAMRAAARAAIATLRVAKPTAEQVEAFKTAWAAADESGAVGHRVESGLIAAFAAFVPADPIEEQWDAHQ